MWLNNVYSSSLKYFLEHRYITWPVMAGTIGLIMWLMIQIPSEMAPLEDRSSIS